MVHVHPGFWVVLAGGLGLLGCGDLQIEPTKIEIGELTVASCSAELDLGLPPDERGKSCYEIRGVATNMSSRDLRRINLYGVIEDADGNIVREGRLGGLPDLVRRKELPFMVRVFFTQKLRGPIKLEAFRAKGLTE